VTDPGTLVPPAVKVNVVVSIVAGFIALLNVAVITTGVGQTRVEPAAGVTEVTVGGVSGSPGFPAFAFLSESPHPATRAAARNAEIQMLLTFNLLISFSSSPSARRSAPLPAKPGM
jgi:hypothetical protein